MVFRKMARKKSATRRNKQFKSVDPFRKGKSTKGLGQDIGLVSQQMVRVIGGIHIKSVFENAIHLL